jgi:drug/metabolite transporter (DMT)-like permease
MAEALRSKATPGSLTGARMGILAGATLFSTGGAAIKACHFSGLELAGLRSGVAVVAVLCLLPSARRGWTARSLLVGLAYALTMILFVLANKLTTAASTIFLQATAPLYILLLGPWLLAEPIRRLDLVFLGALAAGLALFFVGMDLPAPTAPDPLLGNALAAASGATYALTILGLRWMGRGGDAGGSAAPAVLAGNLIVFLGTSPWFGSGGGGSVDWLVVIYLGVFQIALGYAFLTSALRRLPALEASLLMMVEPVLNPLWAFILQGERPGPWTLAGGGLILLATALKTWWDAGVRGAARPQTTSLETQ